ncbi:MAG: trypsin-like peptidase domain-containing protein [Phycisphaerales bacterium]|nr:MAG: trypsin-like peptidase domain-containing protein [Phycisphaerales bacterium]
MQKHAELKRFALVFLGTALGLGCLLQFDVFERIAFAIEKGRLKALEESLPSQDRLDELTHTTRAVAQLVAPAVVSIITETVEEEQASMGEVSDALRDPFGRPDGEQLENDPDAALASSEEQDTASTFEDWLRDHIRSFDPEGGADAGSMLFQGIGSGFIFDADKGHILTNSHVVDGADVVRVYLSDGRETQAKVLGSDPESDLAVIRIDLPRLHELSFGDSDDVAVGEDVLAVGNPFGLDGTFSKGIISAYNRRGISMGIGRGEAFLQTDAVINPGNSGGPLVNMHGAVIGINSAIATHTGRYEGVGFAIPSNRARNLIEDLIDGGPGFLGVLAGNVALFGKEARALQWYEGYGAWVDEVVEGSAADRGGIKPDDIILEINDQRIETSRTLSAVISALSPGAEVKLTLWRDGQTMHLPVRLGRRYAPR